jgi:uncharacterized protein YecT (DUF1311 family)
MSRTIATLTAAAVCAMAAPAAAEEPRYSPQYEACVKQAGGTTFPTIECIAQEHRRWDAELNQQYRFIRGRLDGARRNGFDAAQIAWVNYRDANCGFYNDPQGGTIARIDANSCMLEMTARRVIELRGIRGRVAR